MKKKNSKTETDQKAYQQGFNDAVAGKHMDDYFQQFEGYVAGYRTGKERVSPDPANQDLIQELKDGGVEDYEIEGFLLGMEDANAGKKRRRNYKTILGYAQGYEVAKKSVNQIRELTKAIKNLGPPPDFDPEEEFDSDSFDADVPTRNYFHLKHLSKKRFRKQLRLKLVGFFSLNIAVVLGLLFLLRDGTNSSNSLLKESGDIPPEMSLSMHFKREDGKWGLFDKDGNSIIDPVYDSVNTFYTNDGTLTTDGAIVIVGNRYGFVDGSGNEIIKPKFEGLRNSVGTLLFFKENDLWGVISRSGKIIIPSSYTTIGDFSSGYAQVEKNKLFGVINTEGIEIIPTKYEQIGDFNSSGVTWAVQGENIFLINTSDERIPTPTIDEVNPEDDGFRITSNTLLGYANTFGRMIIPCKYSTINVTLDGFYVEQEGNWGFYSKDGSQVVPCKYERIFLKDGGFLVQEGNMYGFYNSGGDLIVPCKYSSITHDEHGILVESEGDKGLYGTDGEVIIACIYEELHFEGVENLVRIKLFGQYGWFDLEKNLITIPIKYDEFWGEFNHKLSLVEVQEGARRYKIDYTGKEIEGKSIKDKVKQLIN